MIYYKSDFMTNSSLHQFLSEPNQLPCHLANKFKRKLWTLALYGKYNILNMFAARQDPRAVSVLFISSNLLSYIYKLSILAGD